jgi:SAM-dependent methyltransferase
MNTSRWHHVVNRAQNWAARNFPVIQSSHSLALDSQYYWQNSEEKRFKSNSHWLDDQGLGFTAWSAIGQLHHHMFVTMAAVVKDYRRPKRIIEWGCGGGANAVHYSEPDVEYHGVEVSQASLDECASRFREHCEGTFTPVLIDVDTPELAIDGAEMRWDLFLCLYVFELFPYPEYGQKILKIASRALVPGGLAFIQIKYETSDKRTRSRRWGYKANLANMTTYRIEEFWQLARDAGLIPIAVHLRPEDDIIDDQRYAYFLLQRPHSECDSLNFFQR